MSRESGFEDFYVWRDAHPNGGPPARATPLRPPRGGREAVDSFYTILYDSIQVYAIVYSFYKNYL